MLRAMSGGMRVVLPPSLGEARSSARAELLSDELSRRFDTAVSVEVAESYEQLGELALDADIVWAPPQIRTELAAHARAIFSVVRNSEERGYRAALLARVGTVRELGDLRGMRAAWVSKQSMGGYLLVRNALVAKGMAPDEVFREQTFFGSYAKAIDAVASREADVASIYTASADDADVRASLDEAVGGFGHRLQAVLFTDRCPPDGIVVTRRLSIPAARRVVEVLTRSCPPLLLESINARALRLDEPEDSRSDSRLR